jgi:hypothetical protein
MAIGDDVLCLHNRTAFYVWNRVRCRWVEDNGPVMAHQLMNLAQQLFLDCLRDYTTELSKLVANNEGDSDAANNVKDIRSRRSPIRPSSTAT